jgi:prolyl-tRNA synthetase
MPEVYDQFVEIATRLENYFRDMQDMEFTIEDGHLYMLQTRNGKRTAQAALQIACDLVDEGMITEQEAVLRVEPKQLDTLLHPQFDAAALKAAEVVGKGLAASPGSACGQIVFTAEEAEERTIQMLNVYADFCEQVLAIPVIKGQKTDKEKFAGAEATYTIESLMHDGKALQSGTSHNFGDGFAKAFDIQFTDKDNTLKHVYQTSWGMTTRMIGAIIMVHGDDNGLVLPPRIAPVQIMVVPIQQKKEGVLDKAFELRDRLIKSGFSVKVDDSDKSPGWKFADCEMRGIPLRVEIGPKDMENNQAVLVRRDTHEKTVVSLDELEAKAAELLDTIQHDMLEKARKHRDAHTYTALGWDEFVETINTKPGFVKAMWCGCQECEDKIKEVTGATSRCMPFEQETLSDKCVCCGKPAKKMVYWGRAY